jgi:hypothetical protein
MSILRQARQSKFNNYMVGEIRIVKVEFKFV